MTILGFTTLAELHRGRTRVVYRARRNHDGAQVILKTVVEPAATPASAASLRREHEILKDLDVPGVVRVLGLVTDGQRPALVLEDTGGEPLAAVLALGRLDVVAFLKLAMRLAAALGELHRRRIIHKDINPKNILVDIAGARATLIDFSIATRLPFEKQGLAHPSVLEGTIAYISPEQTGRMNRDIDYRTDFYSLGVTLYEMLTGRTPFDAADPLELIHAHIARTPPTPRHLDPSIPGPLSEIVMKLMAKTAEARYQSAFGLGADLEQCLEEWECTRTIERVIPGAHDVAEQFVVPQKLYGRELERAALLEAFDRCADGPAELMLVSGYAGIGKSSLIHEIHRSLTGRRGYFIAGKFDQLVRNVPYAAVTQAFGTLTRQLLAESDEAVARWRAVLLAALGSNVSVLLEVIPALERIVGPQPRALELGGTEAQNRFNRVFLQFLRVFARPEHPLVVFLDDLQWTDAATLALLRTILANDELRGLLVIGAYRDNEVGEEHALFHALADIERSGAAVSQITLGPLAIEHLEALVGEALRCGPREARPLAELVRRKTDGNPFFVTQFLSSVHQEGLLAFDPQTGRWRADAAGIERMGLTDNVVDLMARRIGRLAEPTQHALRLAACIGNDFEIATLATVSEGDVPAVVARLWDAIQQGLVLPAGETYGVGPENPEAGNTWSRVSCRFLHDRVQQAAYALIPSELKRQVHLRVGRLLLAHRSEAEVEDQLFAIVDQLNHGIDLITDGAERRRLAELNLGAGRKAKASTAYSTALGYFEVAASLLPVDAWTSAYELTYALHLELAECEYLCGEFARAETTFDLLVRQARSREDSAEAYILRCMQNENQARYTDAIAAVKEGLEPFGIRLPDTQAEQMAAFEAELESIQRRLGDRPIESLIDLPVMTDREVRACMRLLASAYAPVYIAAEAGLLALTPAIMVRLSLEHGNSEESAVGYVVHGITVGTGLGDYAAGHEFGQLALAVNDRFDDRRSRAKVHHLFSCFVNPWRRPIATCFVHSREAHRAGLEAGDFGYATYAIFHESWYALLTGDDLAAFQQEYRGAVKFLEQIHNHSFVELQKVILQWGQALQGLTASPGSLDGDGFSVSEFMRVYGDHPFFATFLHSARLAVNYTFGRFSEAAEAAASADKVVAALSGAIWPAVVAFYDALTLAARFNAFGEVEAADAVARMRQRETMFMRWADNSPEWFGPQRLLVSAEIARVTGAHLGAIDLYAEAVRAAGELGEPRLHALANELYGAFWLTRGEASVASMFLTAAHRLYTRWGAAGKTEQLRRLYPELIERDVAETGAAGAGGRTGRVASAFVTTVTGASSLDAVTVIKAAQAITGEIELESLLAKLMRILIENAGAERGVLVLRSGDALFIQAEGDVAPGHMHVRHGIPLEASETVPTALVKYVMRTRESVVLQDAGTSDWAHEPSIAARRPRSVLCTPILNQGQPSGAVYFENNLTSGAFTPDRIQVVQVLSAQAAIAIRNAELFAEVSSLRDRLQAENVYLQEEIKTQHGFEEIIGDGPALRRVLAQVEQVAPGDTTVLISGETGTGKELIARAIHNLSPRRDRTLVTINCGAMPAGLIESELFGHEKGAFTGAHSRKLGRFELADGGTLFLDEIGDLPLDMQVRLLRVLQDGAFERVGGTRTIRVDVRVIAATNRDLGRAVTDGKFRSDLFYRLNVFPIRTPALRDRPTDISLLVRYFVMKFAGKLGKHIDVIRKSTLDALTAYSWPGNIRELRNVIERSVIITRGDTLELGDWLAAPTGEQQGRPLTLEAVEREHIRQVLESTGWRVSGPRGAARVLDLKPTTLEARMKKLGIQRPV